MSAQEERNEIIKTNVPLLIKHLTKFKDDDENLQKVEHFAWSVLRGYKSVSVNSHEIRRKIEGMKEKFLVANYPEYAEHLERLCDSIINHPLCLEHYEIDVHWALIDLLLSLAYNPVGALKRNASKLNLSLSQSICEDSNSSANDDALLIKSLKAEFCENTSQYKDDDSDFSDWSDCDDPHDEVLNSSHEASIKFYASSHEEISATPSKYILPGLPCLKPPQKSDPYEFVLKDKTTEDVSTQLRNAIQSGWWTGMPQEPENVESNHVIADFAKLYKDYLQKRNLTNSPDPFTVTEICFLRELIWIFHKPIETAFFRLTDSGVQLRKNVTIPSLSVPSFASFIGSHFLTPINQMQKIKMFLNKIYDCPMLPPKSIEYYATSLKQLMAPFWEELLKFENRLAVQKDFEVNTLITFSETMRKPLQLLDFIYSVHEKASLPLERHENHITSAYLLVELLRCNRNSVNKMETNLTAALFLSSVRSFIEIIDTWWSEGRLEDWSNEFVVEITAEFGTVSARVYQDDEQQQKDSPITPSSAILEDKFFHVILQHCLEAGQTLNLLYEIDRIGELHEAYDATENNLYNVFINDIFESIAKLIPKKDEQKNTATTTTAIAESEVDGCLMEVERQQNGFDDFLRTKDEFLVMLFRNESQCIDRFDSDGYDVPDDTGNESEASSDKIDTLALFKKFEETPHVMPLEEIILKSLSRILCSRISFANSFVMNLYLNEFEVLRHLGNLRKVLLFDACDLMHEFCQRLFKKIESGAYWANSVQLTNLLDDILCSRYPDMSSLFRCSITPGVNTQHMKVYEAVEAINIKYECGYEMQKIISEKSIEIYNSVFRLLLKVKWSLMTLEAMSFSRIYRNRSPYLPTDLIVLCMRRLEQLRFWMFYIFGCIQSHLTTQVLHAMGEQLNRKISECTNLKEMAAVHNSFIKTLSEHTCIDNSVKPIQIGFNQLVNLVDVLHYEWLNTVSVLERSLNPFDIDLNDSVDSETRPDDETNRILEPQITEIEEVYIRCHQYLANTLNNEVYLNQKSFLSGLSFALNSSLPH